MWCLPRKYRKESMHICRVIFFFVRVFECENVNICYMCYLEKRAVTERYRYNKTNGTAFCWNGRWAVRWLFLKACCFVDSWTPLEIEAVTRVWTYPEEVTRIPLLISLLYCMIGSWIMYAIKACHALIGARENIGRGWYLLLLATTCSFWVWCRYFSLFWDVIFFWLGEPLDLV
jgi:hypothetical protein